MFKERHNFSELVPQTNDEDVFRTDRHEAVFISHYGRNMRVVISLCLDFFSYSSPGFRSRPAAPIRKEEEEEEVIV